YRSSGCDALGEHTGADRTDDGCLARQPTGTARRGRGLHHAQRRDPELRHSLRTGDPRLAARPGHRPGAAGGAAATAAVLGRADRLGPPEVGRGPRGLTAPAAAAGWLR